MSTPTASLRVCVPLRTTNGQNAREHHFARARRVKAERQSVAWALLHEPRPAGAVRVLLTRVAPSNGLDGDNLQGALKAVRDQVATFLGRDDADPSIAWSYAQRRGVKGEWAIEIQIEGVAP